MPKEVKAKYTHGILKPLEKLDLQEGEEVTIVVKDAPTGKPKSLFGLIPGGIIKGDIIAPLDDVEWEVLK